MVKYEKVLVQLSIGSLGVAAAAIIAAAMIFLKKPEPQGYAVFPDGRIVPLVSIQDEADSVKVAHFASSCILQGFNFDFRNYNTQLAKMNTCMSDDGYVSFNNAVQSLLDVVKQKRLVMVTDIIEPTVVIKTAVVDGVRKYRTRTIVLISFDGQNSRVEPVRWVVEAVMNNVPLSKKASGLESTSINAKPYIPTKS